MSALTMANSVQEPTAATASSPEPSARPNRWPRRIAVAVGLLVAAALGFGGGVWLALPDKPGEDSAEVGFARDMSVHHGQAVSMAMLEYRNGANDRLQRLAYDIALTQQGQIGIMDAWLRDWNVGATSDKPPMSWMDDGEKLLQPDGRMPGMASDAQMETLRQSSGDQLDVLFCQLMITHHLGGIHMIDAVLAEADDDEVIELARQMKRGQQTEIDALQQIQQQLSGKVTG